MTVPKKKRGTKRRIPVDWTTLGMEMGKGVFASIDWGEVVKSNDFAQKMLAQPQTIQILAGLSKLREPVAQALIEQGVITEAERGMGLVPLLQRKVQFEMDKKAKEKEEENT